MVMIHEARIYTPDGKLKETVPGHELSKRFWQNAMREPEPEARVKSRMNGGKARARSAKGPAPATLQMLADIVEFMRNNEPPEGCRGWTLKELHRAMDLSDFDYKTVTSALHNARKESYGAHPVIRGQRAGYLRKYEYYVREGSR